MADYSYDDLDRLLVQVRRIEEHRVKGAEKEIKAAYEELLQELRHYLADTYSQYAEDDQLTYGILQKHGYYARFLEEVEKKINDISPAVKRLIRSTVEQTYAATYNGLVEAVKKSAGALPGFEGLKGCTPDVMRKAVENPISKLTLDDRLEKHRKEIVYDIKQNISVGLMNGDRYSTMANRIKQSVNGDYKKAIRITRTETHRVRQAGEWDSAVETDKQLQAGSSGMRMTKTWRTMKDERVRPAKRYKTKKGWKNGKPGKYDHKSMDGVMLLVDEEFKLPSGATTQYPGGSGVAGEDINCRCYLSYQLKKVSVMNDIASSEQRRKRTQEELQAASEEALEITEKYSTRKSKWSGNVVVDDKKCQEMKVVGQKLWSCDILLKSTASDKTIIHEHLHARSGSYLNMITIIPYSNMEEASVELLAREICSAERIPYDETPKAYVSALREINQIAGIRDTNLDFAISLFGKDIRRRYKWLSGQVDKYLEGHPEDAGQLALLLRHVRGMK
ncbi:MAG: phage minor head protein [Lachnospiraceae bacterium]|nr:phage minor head protein [Lachnospiraceae bacterium]